MLLLLGAIGEYPGATGEYPHVCPIDLITGMYTYIHNQFFLFSLLAFEYHLSNSREIYAAPCPKRHISHNFKTSLTGKQARENKYTITVKQYVPTSTYQK